MDPYWECCSPEFFFPPDAQACYIVDADGKPVDLGRGWVVLYVNRHERTDLDGWTPRAVRAALSERFYTKGVTVKDVEPLFKAFNDLQMAGQYGATVKKLKEPMSDLERTEITKKLAAIAKHIQDDTVRDVVQSFAP